MILYALIVIIQNTTTNWEIRPNFTVPGNAVARDDGLRWTADFVSEMGQNLVIAPWKVDLTRKRIWLYEDN